MEFLKEVKKPSVKKEKDYLNVNIEIKKVSRKQ